MSRRSNIYCLFVVLLGAATPVQALNIVLTDTGASPMTTAQFDAFNQGASLWQKVFSDPITVNVNVSFSDPSVFSGPTVLGDTLSRRTTHSYADVRTAMFSDAALGSEKSTVSSLPPGPSGVPVGDINGSRTDTLITLSSANAKALGLGTAADPTYGSPPAGSADAQIRFNTAFASDFDFDRSDGTPSNKVDFVTVAVHEIGHALGFFSVTDVQDGNPGFTLHPNTLDLYRFTRLFEGPSDIAPHSLPTTVRRITAGPASYYDDVLGGHFPPYTPFSLGVALTDPNCNTSTGRCQAAHWRDDQGLLMDPTLADGVQVNPTTSDIHALDYVGYNRKFLIFAPAWKHWFVKWFSIKDLQPFPFDPRFEDFATPIDPGKIQPPFDADLIAQIGMDLDLPGMDNRSATAFARFANDRPNPNPEPVNPVETPKGEQDLTPITDPVKVLPPAILDFFFVSDKEGGQPFTFTDSLGEGGAQLDPSLGEFGGYRITGFIDSTGDGVEGDVDALLTVDLLADQNGIPNPEENNFFTLAFDLSDNLLQIIDPFANLVNQNFGDYNHDNRVDAADYTVWRDTLNDKVNIGEGADGNLNGVIDQGDYELWEAYFGATNAGATNPSGSLAGVTVPEPASSWWMVMAIGAVGTLIRRRARR